MRKELDSLTRIGLALTLTGCAARSGSVNRPLDTANARRQGSDVTFPTSTASETPTQIPSPTSTPQPYGYINFCGSPDSPDCPSGLVCYVTELHPNELLTVRSGICVDPNFTPEPTRVVGTPTTISSERSPDSQGRTYWEIRFDPSQPCGQEGMPECKRMIGEPGWVENWHPDDQWPAGMIPSVDGFTYNPEDGLYYPNPQETQTP